MYFADDVGTPIVKTSEAVVGGFNALYFFMITFSAIIAVFVVVLLMLRKKLLRKEQATTKDIYRV